MSSISASVNSARTVRRTLLLTQRDIERVITMPAAIRVVAEAFRAQARGQAIMPAKVYLTLSDQSDFRAMPAYLARPASCGVKWVNVHPKNRRKGLPTVMGILILNDPKTGFPLAILDGLSITRIRTAAAAGVAARTLARRDARVVGLVGCGAQAPAQLQALQRLFRLRQVRVWGAQPGEAARFCRRMAPALRLPLESAKTVRECVEGADLISTITPSRKPLVMRAWVKPGAHINAIGADAPGKQELDPTILQDALVVVDEREQAVHGGELNVPISRGQFSPGRIHACLGDILLGRAPGRTRPDQITVFDSTGLAVHDIALGAEAVRRVRRGRAAGSLRTVQFFPT